MEEKPIIGITMGDPAGIGAEITLKALAKPEIWDKCRPLVVGDLSVMEQAARLVGFKQGNLRGISRWQDVMWEKGMINVWDMGLVEIEKLKPGEVSAMAGNAAYHYVEKVIRLALAGQVDATVTNAISKEALNLAGHHYSGHTEIYGHLTETSHYTMMLVHKNLRVVHVSTHVSLREACDRVKKERILEVIRIAWKACRDLGIVRPRIGVAGLNPHSGENGMFGREEICEIIPAIRAARDEEMDVEGPVPPDTVFPKALGGWYDIVVAMYHDQGHIPLKVEGFRYNQKMRRWDAVEGVNITLGLPIIRTSVDHGTAFDQAGKGSASERSLEHAIEYAVTMAGNKHNRRKPQDVQRI